MHRCLFYACLCAALASCTAAPANPDAVAIIPEPGRALVVGWGHSAGENARAALTPVKGVRVSSLYVAKANEQKISFGENIARLSPGEYDLTITCGLYIDYRFFPVDTVIHAQLSANRVYRLRAEPQGRRCYPSLEDVGATEKPH